MSVEFAKGNYRMRNGEVAEVTSSYRPNNSTTKYLYGANEIGDPMVWIGATGAHSAGGHVFPGHAAFDLVDKIV